MSRLGPLIIIVFGCEEGLLDEDDEDDDDEDEDDNKLLMLNGTGDEAAAVADATAPG